MRDPGRGLTREGETRAWQRLGDDLAGLISSVGLERGARLVAVALVPVFFVGEDLAYVVPLYTALIAYVLVTSFAPRNRFLRAADLAVAAALVVATGGTVLPFLLFLMVAVAGTAVHGGMLAGLAAGGTLTVVLVATLAASQRVAELGPTQLLPVGLLLPLTGVTMGAAAQVYADQQARDRRVLQEANRLLAALRSLADELPGGLDVTTVAAAMVAEVRQLPGTRAALVYTVRDGVLQPASTSGMDRSAAPILRVDLLRGLTRPGRAQLRTLASLPDELQRPCAGHRWWVLVGMHRDHDLVGALLIGVDEPDAVRSARPRLVALAEDGAVALQNAQLFDGTRERAAQAARTHLAADLHDGTAQALAHLRMELELLSMTADEGLRGELERLGRVARTALEDLRATISGLRSDREGDLAEAIYRHIDHLTKRDGPVVTFEHRGDARLDAITTDEVLRVVQEALSNALRHADASTIEVSLERQPGALRLVVADDGRGFGDDEHAEPVAPVTSSGVGLRSMHERAARLDGRLTIRSQDGGGTRVELTCDPDRRGSSEPMAATDPTSRRPIGG